MLLKLAEDLERRGVAGNDVGLALDDALDDAALEATRRADEDEAVVAALGEAADEELQPLEGVRPRQWLEVDGFS